jgi:hypothetical protein
MKQRMRTVITYLALAAAPFTMLGLNTCTGGHAPDDDTVSDFMDARS